MINNIDNGNIEYAKIHTTRQEYKNGKYRTDERTTHQWKVDDGDGDEFNITLSNFILDIEDGCALVTLNDDVIAVLQHIIETYNDIK